MSKTQLRDMVVSEERAGGDGRPAPPARRADGLHIAIFAIALLLPSLGMLLPFPIVRAPLFGEPKVPFPKLQATAASVASYPVKLYQYLDGHFACRREILRWHALIKLHWLHASPSKQVVVGKDGWLYYAGRLEPDCWRRTVPLYPNDLDHWQQVLHARQDWLAARGIKFLFVICPDKHTVYPEHMPYSSRPPALPSRLDLLADRLRSDPAINFLDLREALLLNKDRYSLYPKLDSHWSEIGGLLASQQIIARLRAWYPQVVVPQLTDFTPVTGRALTSDQVELLGLSEQDMPEDVVCLRPKRPHHARTTAGDIVEMYGRDGSTGMAVTERPHAPIPRAVILRDSFGIALIPYLAEQFGHATCVWTPGFDRDLITREKPNVVIWEMVERELMQPIPQWAVGADDAAADHPTR